jgi:cobyrinic acid a,c-diamide synthase
LARMAEQADLAVVEGNRGLFDGLDASGSHSTAQLARLTESPLVLVIDATKATRTLAALVLGCQKLEPDLSIAGVILNRVGTARQEKVIRQALAESTDLPVFGAIPRLCEEQLPSRHLGLLTAAEHTGRDAAIERVGRWVADHLDWTALETAADQASPVEWEPPVDHPHLAKVRIGVLKDRAFSFYYPENLEALEQAGAELVFVSPLADETLPDVDGLYAGGGFPEEHVSDLAANRGLREQIAARIDDGLPVWAECGGLMYLARELVLDGKPHPMVGALPIQIEQTERPQGHGYVRAKVDSDNPFLQEGAEVRGHEFHYSRLLKNGSQVNTVMELMRGVGVGHGRDGIHTGRVVATYTHLHALGEPAWAPAMVQAAAGGV